MKFTSTTNAVIHTYERTDEVFRIVIEEGEPLYVQRAVVEYFDDGDMENGPKLGAELSSFQDLECSRVHIEFDPTDLNAVEAIINDAIAYSDYCNQHQPF